MQRIHLYMKMIKDKTPYDLRTWLWQAISHSGDLDLPKVEC